jgi:hypothetical protein
LACQGSDEWVELLAFCHIVTLSFGQVTFSGQAHNLQLGAADLLSGVAWDWS